MTPTRSAPTGAPNIIWRTLLSREDIARRVAELGREITDDYRGQDLVLVGVLKGAIFFLTDLAKHIDLPLTMDFLRVSSYGDAQESSGMVQFLLDLSQPIRDKHVLIVEDIIDTGRTMAYLSENLLTRAPASLKVCTLLDKPARRQVPVALDYVGFQIEDVFVFGYGLDYQGRWRNLPDVVVKQP